MLPSLFLCTIVMIAAATDLTRRRIPNAIALSGLATALIVQLGAAAPDVLHTWLGGAAAGLFLFLPFYILRGMAAGDVKLMAAVGSFVGPQAALQIGLVAFVIGGVMALAIVLSTGRLRACIDNVVVLLRGAMWQARAAATPPASVGGIPYAVAIALATLAVLSWQRW